MSIICRFRVPGKEIVHVPGSGKHVRGMAQLGCLYHNRFLEVENIFVAKQTNPSSAARELVVEEPVVVRTPANLSNVEIVWDPEI
jgi:hypothetical protein